MNPDPLVVEIVTPTSKVELHGITYVRAPGLDGMFGVLQGHVPAMIALDMGEIRIQQKNVERYWATSGGFAEIHREKVILLLETAEQAADIDMNRARSAEERARRHLEAAEEDLAVDRERAQQAFERAKNRLAVAERAQ